MSAKLNRNPNPFRLTASTFKTCLTGWSMDRVRSSQHRSGGDADRTESPGAYGLLAGFGRR